MRGAILLAMLLGTLACDSITGGGELWAISGTGNDVIDRPRAVERLRVTGAFSGNASNFIVYCGDDLVVNETLGTAYQRTQYAGTHLLEPGCNPMEIKNSTGVAWTFTEVR